MQYESCEKRRNLRKKENAAQENLLPSSLHRNFILFTESIWKMLQEFDFKNSTATSLSSFTATVPSTSTNRHHDFMF